jgi:hypothetical protein
VIEMRVLIAESGAALLGRPLVAPPHWMDVLGRGHSPHDKKKKTMNTNVLKDRLERIERALDVMRDPGSTVTLIETVYTTGVRDALQGVLDDSPEDDR